MATLEFWYEFGSTYTYLTVARIRREAQQRGVEVQWKPFLLMPLMIEQGLTQGPFLPFPRKLAYMWRDLERRAAEHGLPYRRPDRYPPDDVLTSARVALLGSREGWCDTFTESVFEQHWTRGRPIGSEANLREAIESIGRSPDDVLTQARAADVKAALRAQTEEAQRRGLFGSPSFVVADELFWGDDRLEQALDWARAH